ncbi:diguanylate cyclase [Marinobacter sp. VGCF2001]|uniref:diguanylate cyclase n=1 Tax=Marinobacter sp. VGCF2001 TaxID=3417189 RepID=UPI003CEC462E
MDSRQQEQIANRLKVLQSRFVERLRGELADLDQLAHSIRAGKASPSDLASCCQRLHQLAGSAGTFGFHEFGQKARALEKRFKSELESVPGDEPLRREQGAVGLAEGLQELIALADVEQTAPGDAGAAEPASTEDPEAHGMQVRLLVVDDGSGQLQGLSAELRKYGFDVWYKNRLELQSQASEPGDSGAGIAAVLCHSFSVDLVAHDFSGRDVGHYRAPPPILCVGEEDSFQNRYRVADSGGRAFFPEPVDFPELVERIEALVEEQSAGAQARVMIVDDDRELAEHYCLVLESVGIQARPVSDPLLLIDELHAFEPELLLMDIELGEYSGVTLARMVRFQARWLSLPIIYLSSEDDPERQLRALSGGADEFLVKPVSDDYLIRSVQMRCHRARQLADLMNRDSLTRLLKHALIKQEVERERVRAERGGYESTVVLLDIDHFKRVNDTWGHGQGDVVIRTLANLLRNRLRESDAIGRYGGEEFLIVLPNCDAGAARALIARILASFSELEFSVGETSFQVTFSAGIAPVKDFTDGDQIIEAADRALYAQKRDGRNGVKIYQPGM